MKVSKRILAVLLSVLLLLPTLAVPFSVFAEGEEVTAAFPNADPDEPYYVVGRFQNEGDKAEGASEVTANDGSKADYPVETYPNLVTMGTTTLTAATPVDLTGWDTSALALVMDITITRADGVTGTNSLPNSGNQMLHVNNAGANVAQLTGSPYLTTFTTGYNNAAGVTITYVIPWGYVHTNGTAFVRDAAATAVDSLQWSVYNDSYKVDINKDGFFNDAYAMNVVIENARIVDTTRDGEGYKHGIVAEWVGSTPLSTLSAEGNHTPQIFPWANPTTNALTADMDTSKLRIEADVMYTGNIDANKIVNGQARFQADGKEYSVGGWSNGKTPNTDTWYHFEWAVSEFYYETDKMNENGDTIKEKVYLTDASTITRFFLFNYNDDGDKEFTSHVKNIRIVDTTVTGPREDLEAAVSELKNAVFDENDAAVTYDAAVAAGEAVLADRTATSQDMIDATADIIAAKAALTNIVDMAEDVIAFPGHGNKTEVFGTKQFYFDWTTGDVVVGDVGANLTDDGTTIGANRYVQATLTLYKNEAYTGDIAIADLGALLGDVQFRVRTNTGGQEQRTNSYFMEIVGEPTVTDTSVTYTLEVLLDASAQHEVNWANIRNSLMTVNLTQDVCAQDDGKNTPVYAKLNGVKIVNKTAAVLKEELTKEANASVANYEEDDALTAYVAAQDAAKALLAGEPGIRAIKAAVAELATLKEALTAKETPVAVDKTALDALLKAVEASVGDSDKYTDESVANLTNAYNAAKAVYDSADATQDAVNEQVGLLQAAIDELELKPVEPVGPDRTALNAAIADAEAKLASDRNYTAETKAAVEEALADAKAVAADADQATIDAATKALEDAIDALAIDAIREIKLPLANGEDEITSEEDHYLGDVGVTFGYKDEFGILQNDPMDLTPYIGSEAYIKFDIRINRTADLPEGYTDADWIKFIRNGSVLLFTAVNDDGSLNEVSGVGKWPIGEMNSNYKLIPGAAGNLLEDAVVGEWLNEVTVPVPEGVINAGELHNWDIFMYNDLHQFYKTVVDPANAANYTEESHGSSGATISIRNVYLVIDSSNQVDKTTLEDAIAGIMTDDELANYTEYSVEKYKELFDAAKAVLADENATAQDVVEQVNILKTAASVLVEKNVSEIPLIMDETTSAEAHHMNVNQTFAPVVNFGKYGERDSVKLSFNIRVNKTENFPEVLAEAEDTEWIKYIRNGTINLWAGGTTDEYKTSMATAETPLLMSCGAEGNVLANAILGQYSYVEFELPASIVAAGQIDKIEIFLYNDLHALNEAAGNDKGVTISVKDVKLTLGDEVSVDKSALEEEVAKEVTDFTGYTADSVAAYQAALAEAKAVLANPQATAAQVDAALAALKAAVLVEEGADDVVKGDLDGVDGVKAADALLALQIATKKVDVTDAYLAAGDVDDVAGIQPNDALLILQYATQKIDTL